MSEQDLVKRKCDEAAAARGAMFFSGPPPAGCTSGLPPAGGSRAPPPPDKVMLAQQQQDPAIPAKRLRVDNGDGLTQGLGGGGLTQGLGGGFSGLGGVSGGDSLGPSSSTGGGQGVVMPLLSSQTSTTTITEIQMKIANNKRILVTGKGSDNINYLQSKSGANIKIIPKFLPYNDTSTESTIYIDRKPENVERAKELVNEIISEGYQPPPRQWGHPGNPPKRESGYGFEPPGGFLSVPPQACRSNSQTSRSVLPQAYGAPPQTGNISSTSGSVPPQASMSGQTYGSYKTGQVQHITNSYSGYTGNYHGNVGWVNQAAGTSILPPLPPPPPLPMPALPPPPARMPPPPPPPRMPPPPPPPLPLSPPPPLPPHADAYHGGGYG